MAAAVVLFLSIIGASAPAAAQTMTTLSAIGTGSGFDDKNSGYCPAAALSCPAPNGTSADWCSCIQGSGTLKAALGGLSLAKATITEQIVVDWVNYDPITNQVLVLYGSPTGGGGFCYGANGMATISAAHGTLSLILQGELCDGVMSGTADPATLNGAYMITAGTGNFAGASGTGTFASGLADVNASSAALNFQLAGSEIQ